MECTLGNLEKTCFAEFQIASGAISNLQSRAHLREGTPATLSQLVEGALLEFFCDRIFIHAQFFPALHGALSGFRRGARLAQATGRVMGTLKCVWACFCLRSSYVRSLYRVFDDHSIPSDMPPESRASSGAHAPPRPGIRLVDVAIPGSPAAHAMQLPCLQT